MKNYCRVIETKQFDKGVIHVWGAEFSIERGKLKYKSIPHYANADSYVCMFPEWGNKKIPGPGDIIRLKKHAFDKVYLKIIVVRSK
ncbi:MAG: hypothetical protein LBT45_01835 [Rickettsiales bacterium]|jgi:hypothetical protein|nr:hypothetical protein [Rickettsiales bacterium]